MNVLYLANSGVPLFTQSITYQIILLVPIIVIESCIHGKILGLSKIHAVWLSFACNIVSTLAGLLFLIFLAPIIGSIVLGYYLPVSPGNFPFLPLEIMATLIPMFFGSVLLESWVGSFMVKTLPNSKSFWIANGYIPLLSL
ncbi:hypothetical protein [Laspinema olomoucense]|uniref:hypothetical protein n=1 Tax=Laspinema olomoucense TaxID=3231600 RepID=UPI0021BB9F9E|nr:hypothetical protein [Laspinema sp. D3a]MCT7992042.1 hypothetical protein [Laspinema sp. D3a]